MEREKYTYWSPTHKQFAFCLCLSGNVNAILAFRLFRCSSSSTADCVPLYGYGLGLG